MMGRGSGPGYGIRQRSTIKRQGLRPYVITVLFYRSDVSFVAVRYRFTEALSYVVSCRLEGEPMPVGVEVGTGRAG